MRDRTHSGECWSALTFPTRARMPASLKARAKTRLQHGSADLSQHWAEHSLRFNAYRAVQGGGCSAILDETLDKGRVDASAQTLRVAHDPRFARERVSWRTSASVSMYNGRTYLFSHSMSGTSSAVPA